MSQKINVGDYVEVAYPMPCCGAISKKHNDKFTVIGLREAMAPCSVCGHIRIWSGAKGVGTDIFVCETLRKLRPLAALESTTTKTDEPTYW